jgi:4'-phosphopantetheinyl transferase
MNKEISLSNAKWGIYNDKVEFDKNAVHIFKIEAGKYYDNIQFSYKDILSDIELAKANRFLIKRDREKFISRRHSLRSILSKFVFIQPAQLQFHQSGNKKPAIEGIEFNSTHSEDLILIAVNSSAIGIDLEFINPDFDFGALIPSCFNREEQVFISSPTKFYTLWTRKEAILKASGEGLIEKMQDFSCLNNDVLRQNVCYEIKTFSMHQYIFSMAGIPQNQLLCFWNFY